MPFNIIKSEKNITVEISGAFNALLADELQTEFEKIKDEGIQYVIFDLKDTSTLASSGIRLIIFAEERISQSGRVEIKNAKDILLEVIKLSGIDDFIKIS